MMPLLSRASSYFVVYSLLRVAFLVLVVTTGTLAQPDSSAPLPGPDDPVMAGYDLVAYHSLEPSEDGVPGNPNISYRHSNGYLYYFSTQANKQAFIDDPDQYLPKYGGFCAWGMAWEYPEDGWPWAVNHMGPPCGPRDGWAILEDGHLYCSIWRSYQDDFNRRSEEGIRLADARWIEFYGSLTAGPQNNGCYAWNWQECYARSIYDPDSTGSPETPNDVVVPTTPATPSDQVPLFVEEREAIWSDEQKVLGGAATWKWTLSDLSTTNPFLIVELVATQDSSSNNKEYIAFGIAEQLMQGALVVCAPTVTSASTISGQDFASVPSRCQTLFGAGMGTTVPVHDPVQPAVVASFRNATHYTVRFSASLFGCWSNPFASARVLFARGFVSGNGAPQPHLNDASHRQAVKGVNLLSVVKDYNEPPEDTSAPIVLEPLPDRAGWNAIPGRQGSIDVLQGRIHVLYELFEFENEEIVSVQLQDIGIDDDGTRYIGFGFAEDVMTGLVVTCSPRFSEDDGINAICHQWRGQGTNLYPLSPMVDAGGWFLTDLGRNDTHMNITLAGRVSAVVQAHTGSGQPLSSDHLRVICAVGTAATDSGTPLIHQARDREGFRLERLAGTSSSLLATPFSSESKAPTTFHSIYVCVILSALVVMLS